MIKGAFQLCLKFKTHLKLLSCFSHIAKLLPQMWTPPVFIPSPYPFPWERKKFLQLNFIFNNCPNKQLHTVRCEQPASINTTGPRYRKTCWIICCFFQTLRVYIQTSLIKSSCWARPLVTQLTPNQSTQGCLGFSPLKCLGKVYHNHIPEPQGTDPSTSRLY